METSALIQIIQQDFDLRISSGISLDKIKEILAQHFSSLINNDLNKLVSLLYRLDIDEKKLKTVLQENPGQDASLMIAELVIERQLQKIESRKKFKRNDNPGEEESW
jgi:hypothetical protein